MTTILSTPLALRCGLTLPNRAALAPLTNQQSPGATASQDEIEWLARRAEGGFGLVISCATHVCPEGQGFDGQLGIYDDAQLEGWQSIARRLSEHGSLGVAQLYHGGVRSPSRLTGRQPVSASEFDEDRAGFERPRTATSDELLAIVADFVSAADRAHRAGLAGVELHAAHGYLLSQFLSQTMNLRTDEWGGSLENRARLVRAIAQSIRARFPRDFIVGVRLSPEDFGYARGIDLDETLEVAQWLAQDGVDYVHLSLWDASKNTKKRPDEHAVSLARAVLPREVAILAAGNVWTLGDAEALFALGADVVALGKAAILNPDWPRRSLESEWTPRRPPVHASELARLAVGPRFVDYLRKFPGFVDATPS